MRNIVFLFICIFVFSCNSELYNKETISNSQWKIVSEKIPKSDVLELLKKYGFEEDKLTEDEKLYFKKRNFNPFDTLKVRGFITADRNWVENDIRNMRKTIDEIMPIEKEMLVFDAKKVNVKNYKDFYDLINTLPFHRKQYVESMGGEENYKRKVDSLSTIPVHVYLDNKDAGLTFIPPALDKGYDTPTGKHPGKRLDNLKD